MELRSDRRKWPPFLRKFQKMAPPILHWSISQNFPKSNRFGSKMLSNDEMSIVYMIFSYRVAQSPKFFQLWDKNGTFLKNGPPILRGNWKNGPPFYPEVKKDPLPLRRSFLGNIEISIIDFGLKSNNFGIVRINPFCQAQIQSLDLKSESIR